MFKIYKNLKTKHPSISLKSGDKDRWHNLSISHSKPHHDTYIVVKDPHPKATNHSFAYIRKYIRKDKHKIKGFLYKKYRLSAKSEKLIKQYLKKKR